MEGYIGPVSSLKETIRYYKRCFIANFSESHIGKPGHMIPTWKQTVPAIRIITFMYLGHNVLH